MAIEERFPTNSFPFRMVTTIIPGLSIVSAYTLYKYHVNEDMFETFSDFAEAVAYDAMTNTWDRDHSPQAAPMPEPQPARTPGAPSPDVNLEHMLVPISQVLGFSGAKSQRCRHCGHHTAYCCSVCSDARGIVPLHRPTIKYKGKVQETMCLNTHKRNPAKHALASASMSNSMGAQRAKAARNQ